MASYSRKEFETMQQEAIRRVKEMQKRAQSYVSVPPQDDKTSENKSPENNSTSKSTQNRQNNFNHNKTSLNNNASMNRNFNNNQRNNQSQNSHQYYQKKPAGNYNHSQMQGGINPNYQRMPMGNPFSQLFGSNLGAFSKFKNMFKPTTSPQPDSEKSNKDENPLDGLLNGVLKDFDIDEEKIILGILIYLLYKNGSDAKLLLALGYLLL